MFQRLTLLVTVVAVAMPICGCRREADASSDVKVDLSFDPAPPQMGTSKVILNMTDAKGDPVIGAELKLEGNMNHAGMKPSFATMSETSPGHYTGSLEFTMGGDWFIIVSGKTAEGRQIERKIDVPGVRVP